MLEHLMPQLSVKDGEKYLTCPGGDFKLNFHRADERTPVSGSLNDGITSAPEDVRQI